MDTGTPPIQAFLSYSHKDEVEFSFVEPLIAKIKAFVLAKGGRELEIFVDRDSIGWGVDWRASISSSVDNATIFIPLLSANYLASDACREEFLAFHGKAEASGVTELLLPILLFRSPLFGADSTDEVAQIAEALQYKVIEDSLLAGFDSAAWLQGTMDLAESLMKALATAENALAAGAETPTVHLVAVPSPTDGAATPEADVSGLAELMGEIESAVDRMTTAAELMSPALDQLGTVPETMGDLPEEPNAKQMTAWTLRLADAFKGPSLALEAQGRELFDATKSLDESLIKLKQLIDTVDDVPELAATLLEGHKSVIDGFGDLREVVEIMDGFLTTIKPAEMLSVPLRKALQPARRGVTAVRDSLKLIESWQSGYSA